MYKYEILEEEHYGVVTVDNETFNKLNSEFFIIHSSDTVKYMCANEPQIKHLEELKIKTSDITCDWFKICLAE